jgi:hypothetical protein
MASSRVRVGRSECMRYVCGKPFVTDPEHSIRSTTRQLGCHQSFVSTNTKRKVEWRSGRRDTQRPLHHPRSGRQLPPHGHLMDRHIVFIKHRGPRYSFPATVGQPFRIHPIITFISSAITRKPCRREPAPFHDLPHPARPGGARVSLQVGKNISVVRLTFGTDTASWEGVAQEATNITGGRPTD